MNKTETEKLIVKHLDAYMISEGFQHKKSEKSQIEYYRYIDDNNFELLTLSTINYYNSHRVRFGFGKRIGAVEKVMEKINEELPFKNPPYKKKAATLGFGYNSYYGIRQDGLPDYMESEEDIRNTISKVIDFSKNIAIPFFKILNDLGEIDKLINGEEATFLETDINRKFNLQGYFDVRRIIIAKLSSNPGYEELIDKVYKSIEFESAKNGYPFIYDRNDLTRVIPFTVDFLQRNSSELLNGH